MYFKCKTKDGESIEVTDIIGMLSVSYKGTSYLIEHTEDGWNMKVGKMPEKQFKMITDAIAEYVLKG